MKPKDLEKLTKTDLLPHVDFDVDRCIEYARRVNPRIEVLQVSARSGVGMERWTSWLERGAALARQRLLLSTHEGMGVETDKQQRNGRQNSADHDIAPNRQEKKARSAEE